MDQLNLVDQYVLNLKEGRDEVVFYRNLIEEISIRLTIDHVS